MKSDSKMSQFIHRMDYELVGIFVLFMVMVILVSFLLTSMQNNHNNHQTPKDSESQINGM